METVNCTFTDISGNSTQGHAQLATLATGERIGRGAKRAAIIFAASFILLPVPGLHWFPIAGLLIAIYFFFKVSKEPTLIREAEGECPACHQKVTFAGPISAVESKEICPNCRTLLKMKPSPVKLV